METDWGQRGIAGLDRCGTMRMPIVGVVGTT